MMKWIPWLLVIVVFFAAIGLYLFYKKPADIRLSKADFELTARELSESYADEASANTRYLGKVLVVSGTIAGIEQEDGKWTVFLETGDSFTGVTCSFYPEEAGHLKTLSDGQEVTIKGECTGKLMDVVLNHCSIVKK